MRFQHSKTRRSARAKANHRQQSLPRKDSPPQLEMRKRRHGIAHGMQATPNVKPKS